MYSPLGESVDAVRLQGNVSPYLKFEITNLKCNYLWYINKVIVSSILETVNADLHGKVL